MDLPQRPHLTHSQFLPEEKQSARTSIQDDMSWGRSVCVALSYVLLNNVWPFYIHNNLSENFLYRNCWTIMFKIMEEGTISFTKFGWYSPRLWTSRKYFYFFNKIKGRRTDRWGDGQTNIGCYILCHTNGLFSLDFQTVTSHTSFLPHQPLLSVIKLHCYFAIRDCG